jgi:hypothetical protein
MKGLLVSIDRNITVDDFVKNFNEKNNLSGQDKLTSGDFLNFSGDSNISNEKRILSSYTPEEKKEWAEGVSPSMIKKGSTVITPLNKFITERQLIYGKNQILIQKDFNAYFSEYQKILKDNDGYQKSSVLVSQINRGLIDTQIININVRVWIYSKVLGELIDISPLVLSCSTSKRADMGNFVITLSPARKMVFDVEYQSSSNEKGVVNVFNIFSNRGGLISDYFEKYIQYNDLVFIRFESLEMEKDEIGYESGQVLRLSSLANPTKEPGDNPAWYRVWDMIGFVDTVSSSINFGYMDKNVTISGRDFMKLLIEDGAYFYPYKYMSGGENKSIWMGDEDSGVFKRNVLTGVYDEYFFNYELKDIRGYLGFVINHLSNLGVIPDDVFSSYGERRSKLNKVPGLREQDRKLKGVWSIVKLFVDENLEDRAFSGDLGNPDGTLLEFFNRACQRPFVEVIGDTWIDTFNFTVRQPPFTESAIRSVINDHNNYITIENKDLLDMNLSYDTTYYSWYQVTPSDTVIGEVGKVTAAFIPIIFLPQVAAVFGNKKLQISDIYIYVGSLKGQEQVGDIGVLTYAVLSDLLFLIESTAYLPFTRRGTVKVNGDRRIKVGSFVRIDSTDELYYVTGVSNNLSISSSIERTTTITVERGMKWDLIKGVDVYNQYVAKDPSFNNVDLGFGKSNTSIETKRKPSVINEKYSYFNIINTTEIKNSIISNWGKGDYSYTNTVKSDFGVNTDVFDYMMKRKYIDENS